MEFHHKPVLLSETLAHLRVKPDGVYVDGTVGGGGHSFAICEALGRSGRLIGIDKDAAALAAAKERLAPFKERVTLVRGSFCEADTILRETGETAADGILLDLGVSSYQLDTKERGFSYREADAPLDMRMDERQTLTAKEIVNTYSEEELRRILWDFGEERYAGNIARRIVAEREKREIATSGQLNAIIRAAVPQGKRARSGHPSKRAYQALRIACNGELEALQEALPKMVDMLAPGGRLCVITFHSLEDRIVKTVFRQSEHPCTCPPDFPVCVCGKKPKGHVVTKKPILPTEKEAAANSRAKSAKLRTFEKK